ncbi:MAG: protein phosphatase 2C domain-containing protein [Lachnospiraceae bacterium]|nr:protein phosphatase 2C domain-containing protein [Lachnospiraceae bacterium]MDY4970442.1 protein phosphatase 2C domain-containing protein [Lachnospiraceae bacterium]
MRKKAKGSVLTDIGMRRDYNEDAVCTVPQAHFYAVADGIGQMAFGGKTAAIACRQMAVSAEEIYRDYTVHGSEQKAAEELKAALAEISSRIFQKGNDPEVYRYGCTFCGAMVFEKQIAVVNVGDSRAYIKRKDRDELHQITEDHNLAAMAVKNGYMTYEEAVSRGMASRLLNFIGISEETEVDLFLHDRLKAEAVLLCTDGLSSMVSDKDMAVCIRNHRTPERVCRNLIRMANRKGGKDNISVAVVK